MKLLYRVSERGDGWDREWSTKKSWFYLSVWKYFYYPEETEARSKSEAIDT